MSEHKTGHCKEQTDAHVLLYSTVVHTQGHMQPILAVRLLLQIGLIVAFSPAITGRTVALRILYSALAIFR